MKFKDWLIDWLGNYIKPTTKTRTYDKYAHIVFHNVITRLGEYELEELSPSILQKYVTELLQSGNVKTGKGLSPSSVNSIINVIQSSLRTAFNIGYIKEYSADKIKRPKARENKVECFSIAEQKKIEQAALTSKKGKMFGIFLCLYTGLRIGELLALKWKDVDIVNGLLAVNKSCHDGKTISGKTGRIEETPKTESSNRIIPLPKQIIPLIRERKKIATSPYVVSSGDKTVLVRSYQQSFSSLLKRLKIEHKGFHALRHTFATRALECGMDVKTLSEILGHKSPTVTLNRYVHSMIDHKKDMMNKLGKLYVNF